MDANKTILVCNEIESGQRQSWEYVDLTLDKGAAANAQIKFQATGPVKTISKLQIAIDVNGQRRSVQMANIPVD